MKLKKFEGSQQNGVMKLFVISPSAGTSTLRLPSGDHMKIRLDAVHKASLVLVGSQQTPAMRRIVYIKIGVIIVNYLGYFSSINIFNKNID